MEAELRKWRVCTDYFPNCEYIYPTQQKKVKEFLDYLIPNENVLSITIFGSSIQSNCTNDSDLDIYVELKDNCKLIDRYFDFVFDLWTNFTVDERLLKEIEKKGLVVYEREGKLI